MFLWISKSLSKKKTLYMSSYLSVLSEKPVAGIYVTKLTINGIKSDTSVLTKGPKRERERERKRERKRSLSTEKSSLKRLCHEELKVIFEKIPTQTPTAAAEISFFNIIEHGC